MDLNGLLFLKLNSLFSDLNFVYKGFSPEPWLVIGFLALVIFVSFLKIKKTIKLAISMILFFSFLNLSSIDNKNYKIVTLEGYRKPYIVVITPYGNCYYSKINKKVERVLNKNNCRISNLIWDSQKIENIDIIQKNRKLFIKINGKLLKIENKNKEIPF
jgi:hypothetical protein